MDNNFKNIENITSIVNFFFKHQIIIKMFHFQTNHYGAHKAIDKYLKKFNKQFDRFMEIAQGAFTKLDTNKITINLETTNDMKIIDVLENYITILKKLGESMKNLPELILVRDELIADAQQLKYLLSFK